MCFVTHNVHTAKCVQPQCLQRLNPNYHFLLKNMKQGEVAYWKTQHQDGWNRKVWGMKTAWITSQIKRLCLKTRRENEKGNFVKRTCWLSLLDAYNFHTSLYFNKLDYKSYKIIISLCNFSSCFLQLSLWCLERETTKVLYSAWHVGFSKDHTVAWHSLRDLIGNRAVIVFLTSGVEQLERLLNTMNLNILHLP